MPEPTTTTHDKTPPRRPRRTSERVTDAVRKTRDTAKTKAEDAARVATDTFDENPLGVLAGAIAAGAVAAALIPATRQELKALGPYAAKMREALEEAFEAAKDAGTGELTAGGLTLAAASDGIGGLIGKVVKAAGTAASAGASSVKQSRSRKNGAAAYHQPSGPAMDPAPLDV